TFLLFSIPGRAFHSAGSRRLRSARMPGPRSRPLRCPSKWNFVDSAERFSFDLRRRYLKVETRRLCEADCAARHHVAPSTPELSSWLRLGLGQWAKVYSQ